MPSGVAVNRMLGRFFGGVTPEILLDAESVDAIRLHTGTARRRYYLCTLPLLVLATTAIAFGAFKLRTMSDGPPRNPILDGDRLLVGGCFAVAAFFLAAIPEAVLEYRLLSRVIGVDRSLWVRYYATVYGWRPDRHLVAALVITGPMAIFMLWGGCVFGERVDENGVAFPSGLWRSEQPYSKVTAIEVYRGLNAPIGVQMRENLVVRFAGGEVWYYDPFKNQAAPRAADVGAYIAQRSGVPVAKGQLRP